MHAGQQVSFWRRTPVAGDGAQARSQTSSGVHIMTHHGVRMQGNRRRLSDFYKTLIPVRLSLITLLGGAPQ